MKIKEKKQVDALNTLKSDNKIEIKDKDIIPESSFANGESRKELNKIKEIEESIDRSKLVYKTDSNTFDFRKFNKLLVKIYIYWKNYFGRS